MAEVKTASLNIETRQLTDLTPHPKNPRLHPHAQIGKLRDSLDRFGYTKGSIVVSPDGTIITGHGIYEALEAEGYTEADVIVADLDEGLMAAFLVADNKLGEESRWDMPLLNALFADLEDMGMEMEATAFEMEEIEEIRHEDNAVYEDDFDVDAALEEDAVTQTGDLIHLGNHKLLCGDSTKAEDVERLMDGEKAQLVFTDPPWGVGYDGGATLREKLTGDHNTNLYKPCCRMAFANSDEKAALYLWHAATVPAAAIAAAAAGYEIRSLIVWNKNTAMFGAFSAQYKQKHEPCYYCFKKGKTPYWYGETNEVTVWDIDRASVNEFHPTQKPLGLAGRAIKNSSKLHDLVLDLFLGSGATLIAADQLDRLCYGMEISERYCDVIIKRYIAHVGTADEVWVERDGAKLMWDEVNG